MFNYNIKIVENLIEVLVNKKLRHLTYLSSDAVYKDSKGLITEDSPCEPDSLHGLMHLTREKIFENYFPNNLCILRPTLVYGKEDPHNGYGPNSFLKIANKNQNIQLFGKGEERRDHINIDDVGRISSKLILNSFVGKINIVTGKVITFYKIAKTIQKNINPNIKIEFRKRSGPMPHNGYRAFDNKKISRIFKNFKFKTIENWASDE